MKWWKNKSGVYWLRTLHRDLGFFMVGVCIVYGVSGILLNHMNGRDPSFDTTEETLQLSAGMNAEDLSVEWNSKASLPALKRIMAIDSENIRLMLDGGIGIYHVESGALTYEVHHKRPVVYWFNRLHYNRIQGWNVMGDFFALSLIFFALSGIFMIKGKNGLAGRGKWLLIVGILVPVLYVLLG